MMIIRPIERDDLPGLLRLAGETGGGLTSLGAHQSVIGHLAG